MRDFLTEAAKDTVGSAVERIESKTSAEIVVAVRKQSGAWRDPVYLAGFALAIASLYALLYLPDEFPLWVFPIDVTLGFGIGALIAWWVPSLRARLYPSALRRKAVETLARATFVELGIDRTRGRTGVLVFVSATERELAIVPDVGLATAMLSPDWNAWSERLGAAVKAKDFKAFVAALETCAPMLEKALPRSADDVNELPDRAA